MIVCIQTSRLPTPPLNQSAGRLGDSVSHLKEGTQTLAYEASRINRWHRFQPGSTLTLHTLTSHAESRQILVEDKGRHVTFLFAEWQPPDRPKPVTNTGASIRPVEKSGKNKQEGPLVTLAIAPSGKR
jgi:hypothetical protein